MFSLRHFLRHYCEAPRARRASARLAWASTVFEHPVAGPVPAFRVSPVPERVIDVPFLVVPEVRVTFSPFSPEVVE